MSNFRRITDKEVIDLKNAGLTNQQIADKKGVCLTTVTRILAKHKGEYEKQKPGRHKLELTKAERAKIDSLHAMGYSLQSIANETGYSKGYIFKVLKGE